MELTQPCPFEAQGEYLKTHDFLQPLEHVGTRPACAKEGIDTTAKSPHMLPGGIGTYTISHIPYLYHNQQTPKSEVSQIFTVSQASSNERIARDENAISNCSSYAASGFTLLDKSLEKKEHSRRAATMGQWQGMEQRSSSEQTSGLKIQSQSFMDMITSAKGSSQEDDMDDDDEEFVMKKKNNTSTSQRVDLRVVKVDRKGHGNEQKPNTPRSKHSATEQRRRSKINDRFQMLRKVIPNSDQKRDKASFLLEVIEYIHFLQEKVNKHDLVPYKGNLMNLRNHQQTLEPVLADAQALDMDQQCLNRAMETSPFPALGQRNSFFTPATSKLCPVSSDAAMESEKLRGEAEEAKFSVHKGTISISSVYSQGLLKTLTETLQTSGVDLSKASISVQIKLSKKPQKNPKACLFAERQESVRKDVERAFGVLQARFAIVKNPALFWDKGKFGKIMRACIILHNMIVEDERAGYTQYDVLGFEHGEGSSHVDLTFSTDMPTNVSQMLGIRTRLRDINKHQQLKDDLVEHVWQWRQRQH